MVGVIVRVNNEKHYGFIKAKNGDYFFHREDFNGFWSDLIQDYIKGKVIEVQFEPGETTKGLRASMVTRMDDGVNR